MKIKLCMAALLAFLAQSAPSSSAQVGWVYNVKVIRIVNTANGGFNVRLSPDLSGCTAQSGYGPAYGSVYPSQPGINRMKADFMLAFATGELVSVYLGDTACNITEMILGGGV